MTERRSKRVIFVVGEPSEHARMRELSGAVKAWWDIRVVSTEKQAIEEANSGAPADLVLSSGTIAGRGNAALLSSLRRAYPNVTLISFCDKGVGQTTLSHDGVLTMPFSADAAGLLAFVERARTLQTILVDPRVHDLVGELDQLPSAPRAYWALVDAASRPNSDAAEMGRIIQTDPAMTLRILQLVNSAFFGVTRQITSIQQAVTLLGFTTLKGLALSAHVFSVMDGASDIGYFSLEQFQSYCLRAAHLAQRFDSRRQRGEEALTAGMIYDIGKLILALRHPDAYREVVARVTRNAEVMHKVEREVFGVTHAEVGAFLLTVWGIPFPIVECVAFHHQPSMVKAGDRSLLAAVHAADALLGMTTCGDPEELLDQEFLREVKADVPSWRKLAAQEALRT